MSTCKTSDEINQEIYSCYGQDPAHSDLCTKAQNDWHVKSKAERAVFQMAHKATITSWTDSKTHIRHKTADALSPTIHLRHVPPLAKLDNITVEEVTKAIQGAANKQCGLDPVPTWLVKKLCSILAPMVTEMVSPSFDEGSFLDQLKHAIKRLHLKKPSLDPLDVKSYRSISNTSFISMPIKRLVANRLQQNGYNNIYKLFPSRQSAYRRHHSTETAFTIVQNDIVRTIDDGDVSVLVLLNLTAAFDTIDHSVLIDVMQHRLESELNLFQLYITNRTQSFHTSWFCGSGSIILQCAKGVQSWTVEIYRIHWGRNR